MRGDRSSPVVVALAVGLLSATTLAEDGVVDRGEVSEAHSELVLRLGNESNPRDGVWGPVTYGLKAAHTFGAGFGIEAVYVRLHEPETPPLSSFLDEASLTVHAPEVRLLDQRLVLGVTGAHSRTIDMYTALGGLELTRIGLVSLKLGLYAGNASREEAKGRYLGLQIAASGEVGPVEISASLIAGKIGPEGSYRRTAIEAAVNVLASSRLPLAFTVAVEDRYFSFGNAGPVSDPQDALILVLGAEIHFENLMRSEAK